MPKNDIENEIVGQTETPVEPIELEIQVTKASPIVKNIVLVHGAFADGTSWSKIIPLLEAEGYNVVAVQNPLTSLADDVAATKRIIALQDGPVLLVGHSWGGAVITQAGDDPKVAGLVYVGGLCTGGGTVRERCKHPVWMDGRERSRFAWTARSSLRSLPKACWRTLPKDSQWPSGNLRLRYRARAMVLCSTKS